MQNGTVISPLTKISLAVSAHSLEQDDRQVRSGAVFDFVYGIGTEGLSGFETKLHGLAPGARLNIRIMADEAPSYFEHLRCPLLDALKIQPPFDLNIEVRSVAPATNRELVHALANKDTGGCGCDCGCGCGS